MWDGMGWDAMGYQGLHQGPIPRIWKRKKDDVVAWHGDTAAA
jgi:hypothetical protein